MFFFYKVILAVSIGAVLAGAVFVSAHGGEHAVTMTDEGFEPEELTIELGETVMFVNEGEKSHWPASNIHPTHNIYPEFDSRKAILPGESWSFTFDKAGTWRFHDHLRRSLTGRIVVVQGENVEAEPVPEQPGFIERMARSAGGFFKGLWDWFAGLFRKESIQADSTAIFNDKDALRAYIRQFGADKTILRLDELSSQFGSCHTPAHEAGRIAYELSGEKSFRDCNAYCHSGCYHGATEAYFKEHGTADLSGSLKVLCGDEMNPFLSHQCLHGIGHGLMAWTDYDLPEALKSCDLLPEGQSSCWTGVFMENIVGGLASERPGTEQEELSGHFTKYLSDDPQYPCTAVDEKYKGSCYFLQTSRMIQLFSGDFAKVAGACSKAPQIYQRSCFESMGRDIGGAYRDDAAGAIKSCSWAPAGDARIGCLTGAVQDSFWDPAGQDAALGFCRLLTDADEKSACYQTVFSRAPQVLSSKSELRSFCGKAEASYRDTCARLTGT